MTDVLVAGVDVGASSFCMATVNKSGLQIVLNKESARETPSCVSFGPQSRLCGTEAAGHASTNLANTISEVVQLLGRSMDDPALTRWLKTMPFKVVGVESDSGMTKPGVQVQYRGKQITVQAEQLVAALLVDAKQLAESSAGAPLQLLNMACPSHFTDAQRQGLVAAAHIAGLQLGALINNTSAAALTYARFHEQELTKPMTLAIVDVGHSDMQVCIAKLKRGAVEVVAHTWDETLGAREFSELLFDYFAAEFKKKHGQDVHTNTKAAYRLRIQCQKLLKVLSANKEAQIRVECLMNDIDLVSCISRRTLEEMAQPLLQRLLMPMEEAMELAGLSSTDELDVVELIGGGSRIPAVAALVQEALGGRELSRTLNSKEAAAEGCAWQAALQSGRFKVNIPELKECAHRTIMGTWQGAKGEVVAAPLVAAGSPLPADAALVIAPTEPSTVVQLSYADHPTPPPEGDIVAGSLVVHAINPTVQKHPVLRVLWEMTTWGMITVPQAVVGAPGIAQLAIKTLRVGEGVHALQAANLREQGVVVGHDLLLGGATEAELGTFFQQEQQFQQDARAAEAAAEARNTLEALVYRIRGLVEGATPFANKHSKDANNIRGVLDRVEEWLYGDGEHEVAQRYLQETNKLEKVLQHVQSSSRMHA